MIPHMVVLENQLAKNGGVLVGKDVTWADIACYAFFSYVSMKHPDILKDCPNMSVLINKIASNDNIKTISITITSNDSGLGLCAVLFCAETDPNDILNVFSPKRRWLPTSP